MNNELKLICFADETGQDTKGKFFLVAVCVIFTSDEEKLENLLSDIEVKSHIKSSFPLSTLYYAKYTNSQEYTHLISLTIAQAILDKVSKNKYKVKIFFDRINKKSEQEIKKELKKLSIKFKKVRGMKDERLALLRLVDSIAGFIRDYCEGNRYTMSFKKSIKQIHVL